MKLDPPHIPADLTEHYELPDEDEFENCSDKLIIMSDDGSVGRKGLVTEALKELLK